MSDQNPEAAATLLPTILSMVHIVTLPLISPTNIKIELYIYSRVSSRYVCT